LGTSVLSSSAHVAMRQVSESTDHPEPIIEPSNNGAATVDFATRALHLRIRQQEILAELGVQALQGKPFFDLLNQTARLTAEGMEAEFCKVLEYMPAENRFLVRAGVGWQEGIVGVATVGADLESPSGFALRTGKPVISNHLENEQRFRTPELLLEHGIRRAIQVPPRKARQTATLLTLIDRTRCLAGCFLIEPPVMKNVELEALKADLKRLSARVAALEKLLDRIVRQRPVSERQLKKALKSRSLEFDH
jgi:hypothetical protein